jgi:predicted DNA-binding transcriptional regulator AlpA
LLNVKETAQRLKMSRSTLYNRMKQGKFLHPLRIKGMIFFNLAEVEAYCRQHGILESDAADPFWQIGTAAVCHSGISDHSAQLDYYLYRAPKREEA